MASGRLQHRRRYVCMALNAPGRPVPMFGPLLDVADAEEPPEAQGPTERALFGAREEARGRPLANLRSKHPEAAGGSTP